MSFCVDNSFGYYSGIEFLGHVELSDCFPKWLHHFTVSAALYEGPSFSISSPTLVIIFFIVTILGFVIRMQTESWRSSGT
uniref:Uncharacterized protein n=1 Tax=Gorilla gorilla gorilla TaxID=9595 RepID=A0A2I2ZNK5_GORGO